MTVEAMIRRFCAYSALRNLRFFDAFVVLFLLHDLKLDYAAVGAFLAYEKLLMGLLEVPLAVVTDRAGRRRSLVLSFVLAAGAMLIFGASGLTGAPLVTVFVAQTIYGVAEALRTGTHKA
ncbi:MAG: hypothetical protein KC620_19320, partial [Myxococcales bacterium]|nr:hypothetical protein [Myxococcales bacterium]